MIARWIATCGGLGNAPVVPGTVASLPVALLAWLLAPSLPWLVVALIVVSAVGIWAAGREEARLGIHDPRSIVVDEAAGMLVALVGHRPTVGWVVALFLLFRVMDVWKPFPIHRLQSLPGGWGVVCDDLLAGLYANLLLQVPRWLSERPGA